MYSTRVDFQLYLLLFFFLEILDEYLRKPISIRFKIKFASYYLVITRKDLVITRKLSRNYEKICRNYKNFFQNYLVITRKDIVTMRN